jgi:hypothetical protein
VIAEVYRGLMMGFLEGLQVGQKGKKEKKYKNQVIQQRNGDPEHKAWGIWNGVTSVTQV